MVLIRPFSTRTNSPKYDEAGLLLRRRQGRDSGDTGMLKKLVAVMGLGLVLAACGSSQGHVFDSVEPVTTFFDTSLRADYASLWNQLDSRVQAVNNQSAFTACMQANRPSNTTLPALKVTKIERQQYVTATGRIAADLVTVTAADETHVIVVSRDQHKVLSVDNGPICWQTP